MTEAWLHDAGKLLRPGTVLVVCAERGGALDGLVRWLANSGVDCLRRAPSRCTPAWVDAVAPALVVIDAAWTADASSPAVQPLALIAALRARSTVPLVCVTAGDRPDMDLMALEAGCDQVWHIDEPSWLIARRCVACLQRNEGSADDIPGLRLSARNGLLRVGGRRVQLTRAQVSALNRLLRAAPDAVARSTLAKAALGGPGSGPQALRRVDVLIARLRQRLQRAKLAEVRIVSVRNLGYRLEHAAPLHRERKAVP